MKNKNVQIPYENAYKDNPLNAGFDAEAKNRNCWNAQKPNLENILIEGFKDTGKDYAGYHILAKGNKRILYDAKRDVIVTRYNKKTEPEIKDMPDVNVTVGEPIDLFFIIKEDTER